MARIVQQMINIKITKPWQLLLRICFTRDTRYELKIEKLVFVCLSGAFREIRDPYSNAEEKSCRCSIHDDDASIYA